MKQLDIFDYEYGAIRRVLTLLDMAKISNTTAYRNNVYWQMGFDCAYRIIKHELDREGEGNEKEGKI